MSFIEKIKGNLADPLLTFKYFQRLIALFCITLPLILWLTDEGIHNPARPSISNYVYMNHSYVFGMLLCIAAMLFLYNGAVYYKSEQHMHISWHGQWYNVVLGLSLLGVISFPHLEYPLVHYIFAGFFFVGNAVVTGLFYKDKDKIQSIVLAILTIVAMPLAFIHIINVFVAEWISLSVIGIHFILSTIDMDQPVNINDVKKLL